VFKQQGNNLHTSTVKFLGINFIENLSWTTHTQHVCLKLNKTLYLIKSRPFCLAVRAGTAFWNLFEGTNFQKSKNKDNIVYGEEEIRTLAT
jgi:hypothetical protein